MAISRKVACAQRHRPFTSNLPSTIRASPPTANLPQYQHHSVGAAPSRIPQISHVSALQSTSLGSIDALAALPAMRVAAWGSWPGGAYL
jgi:hypothetical protein